MNDVRRELHALTTIECGALQDQEPQMLVGADRVDRRPVVNLRAVDEIQRHLRAGQLCLEQRVAIQVCAEAQLDVLRAVDAVHMLE